MAVHVKYNSLNRCMFVCKANIAVPKVKYLMDDTSALIRVSVTMPMKEWVRQMQPMHLYIILVLSIVFFITELVLSHLTHALTLLLDSYNMLCNILALSGCIITIKHGRKAGNADDVDINKQEKSECIIAKELTSCTNKKKSPTAANQESKLKNTFGWARIDVIVMLICCVFLASLLFSLVVEAIQTLVHIDHNDAIHHPVIVLAIGCIGLILNSVCYILIGGYTFHQGSFLYVNESGDVILDRVVTGDSVKKGERRLSRTRTITPPQYRQRQGFLEMLRDIVGCIFVVICSSLCYFIDEDIAKYIDPILSIFSATILMLLSYPYMKESGLILLQTMPGSMNIDILKEQLLENFPDIVNVHDFHIWELRAHKIISTVHIIFQNPKVYAKVTNEIKEFFLENGITQVTIQPEFFKKPDNVENAGGDTNCCLMKCQNEGCKTSHCCPDYLKIEDTFTSSKYQLREIPSDEPSVNLISVKVNTCEMLDSTNEELANVSQRIEELFDRQKQIIKKDDVTQSKYTESHEEKTLIIKD